MTNYYREVMEDHTVFNPLMFITNARTWEDERKKLEKEFAKISELPAIGSGDRVVTSNISDLTVSTAIKREEIFEKSKKLVCAIEMLDYGLMSLDETEREVITWYYFKGKSKTKEVLRYEIGQRYGKSDRTVQYWISDILDKFKTAIVDKYGV